MDTQYRLDDKYTKGVWYDVMNGDFAEIQESADGELVELVNPETGDVYYDMPVNEWVEDEREDFRPISDEAVEDPVTVVNRALRMVSRNDVSELASYPHDESINLRYARQQVNISED